MHHRIKKIFAREVLDSRGNPTIEVGLFSDSFSTTAIVPSGASTGIHEAVEIRDGGRRYNGKGVIKAVYNINKIISKKVIGMRCTSQREIDNLMIGLDSTENKSKLGANAILAVSMAVCNAGALCSNLPLYLYIKKLSNGKKIKMPIPQMNIINSGRHVGIDNDIQECMILPVGFKKFSEALRAGVETYHELKSVLRKKFGVKSTLLGDEGGFSPNVKNIEERLDLIMQAISNAGYNGKIRLGIDCAASEFYDESNKKYRIMNKTYSAEELADFYSSLIKKFPIISIEDAFSQDDWAAWKFFYRKLGNKMQIVGDDLLATNIFRIKKAIDEEACNALLLKINQIGTITEAIDAANLAFKNKWKVIVSHRSGETEDTFIADLAVGLGAPQVKFGAPARGERTAKYNQLLRIDEKLGNKEGFAKVVK